MKYISSRVTCRLQTTAIWPDAVRATNLSLQRPGPKQPTESMGEANGGVGERQVLDAVEQCWEMAPLSSKTADPSG